MVARKPLSVSLTPELHAFVTELVKAGSYTSSSEVIRAGLRLLRHDETQRRSPPTHSAPPTASGSQA